MAQPLKLPSNTAFAPSMLFGRYLKAHHISRAGFVAAAIGAALLFFLVGAALRLLVGPVSLGPFGGTLSDAIANALPGITVKYDQAAVEWSREEGRVTLVILGARVFDPDGRIIAQAPKADIDLAARPFLNGKVEVKKITLVGVQLTLVRGRDGGLRLGVESGNGGQDVLSNLTDAINASNSNTSTLQSFAVRDARLAVFDEVTGLFLVAPSANLKIETAGPNIAASFDADVEVSGHSARVQAEVTLPPKKGPVSGELTVNGLDLGALGANAKTFAFLKGIALNADLSTSFTIDHGAHLAYADFGIDAHGVVGIPPLLVGPIKIKSARIVGRYDGRVGRILLDDASLTSDKATANVTGIGTFIYDANHALEGIGGDLVAQNVGLKVPGVFAEPIGFQRVAWRGSYDFANGDIFIDHFGVSDKSLSLDMAGKLTLVNGQSPAVAVKAQVTALSLRDFLRYWPLTTGPGAREWVANNMFAGSVGPFAIETHIPAGAFEQPQLPDGALAITIPIHSAEANYLKGLTHVSQLNGVAKLAGDTFSADIASARIGPLTLSNGHVTIANLHVPGAPGDIRAHVDGSMPDLLALLDQKPLNYPTRFGVSVADTKGNATIDLSFRVPMRKQLATDDVGILVKGSVNQFDIALNPHCRLSDGIVNFTVDNNKLLADGTGSIGTSHIAMTWNEDFKSTTPVTTHITAKGTLDESAREALGVKVSDYLKGPSALNAVLTGLHGKMATADVAVDLTPATLALDLVGIDKAAGIPANAHVLATFGPGAAVRTADVKVAVPSGGTIDAAVTFMPDGSLAQLSIPSAKFGSADDFSFIYTRSGTGIDVQVRGHSLDGTRLARRESASASAGGAASGSANGSPFDGPFHISAKLDRLVLRDGVAIAPFNLDATGIGDRPQSLSLSGSLSRTSSISASLGPSGTGRKLTFATNDAGELADGLLGLTGVHGGTLDLSATLPGKATDVAPADASTPDYEGTLTLRDTTLVNQPFIARLFMSASLPGIGSLLQGGRGVAIDKFEVPFSSRNGVISVHDATASGPTIGATADGYIDRPKNAVAIKGSLIPVVGVDFNRVLGAIPLFGNLLVSKKGEGVIGVTYAMQGNADEPTVSVNPLAVLTPGIFRRIFEGRMPNAAQAPSNTAAAALAPPKPAASAVNGTDPPPPRP